MTYYKAAQPVPGKGNSWTLYEVNEPDQVNRMLTYIPQTEEIALYPSPRVKKLFQPERLMPATAEEFLNLWQKGS